MPVRRGESAGGCRDREGVYSRVLVHSAIALYLASAPMTTTPAMHAALARLVNNEQARKQEKIDQSLPKRSSREAELSPRGAAPRLVKRQRPPGIAAPPPPADAWPVPSPRPSPGASPRRAPAPEKRLAFPPSSPSA